jgi:hypothetical protein
VLGERSWLAEILFFVGDASALPADVLGVVDKGFELLEVNVTWATSKRTQFVLSTTFRTRFSAHFVLLIFETCIE